jgi:hypothetical protein
MVVVAAVSAGASAQNSTNSDRVATVVWWQGQNEAALAPTVSEQVKRRGLAWVNVSPRDASDSSVGNVAATIRATVVEGIAAYEALRFADAIAALDRALADVDSIAAQSLDATILSDLFLYRGLASAQLNAASAWDDLVIAARLGATRVLDGSRFSPRVVEEFSRARIAATQLPASDITLDAPSNCALWWDGQAVAVDDARTFHVNGRYGTHWVASHCVGRRLFAKRVAIDQPRVVIAAAGTELLAPTTEELRLAAQIVAAKPFVSVVVLGAIATVTKRSAAGDLLDERTVNAATATDAGNLVTAIESIMTIPVALVARRHWYQSGWVWAVAGVVVTSAVLTPILLNSSSGSTSTTVRVKLPW